MKELLGDRIKHYRERAGLSQRALAAHAKVDPQTIYRLENGKNWLDYETLSRLASTLKVDARALFADPELVVEPSDKELLELLAKRLKMEAPEVAGKRNPFNLEDVLFTIFRKLPPERQLQYLKLLRTENRDIAGVEEIVIPDLSSKSQKLG